MIKNCTQDFGLGPGIIATDTITYTDKRNKIFDDKNPLFLISMREDAMELILNHVTVMVEEVN